MTLEPAKILPYLEYMKSDGRAHTVLGDVRVLPQVWSPQFQNKRDVLVYVPLSYRTSKARYPVLYMHDGQNLFDAVTAYAGHDWRVDETMERLSGEGYEAIVVGIYHGGEQRLIEYNPFPGKFPGRGDEHVAFVCDTLKPFVDANFRTRPEHAATGVLGSSMGGLISLYAFFRRPDIFGLCGAMSPSLFVGRGAIVQYARAAQFNPGRIYLDNGTQEPSARPMYEALYERGYRARRNLKYVTERSGKHTESAWARRLPNALRFLLKEHKIQDRKDW
ncbi:MAG: alpha/beta hydrolase [Chloroflexi bacterium]|nr:alpha/beta hydrolase [Chloroflexota bacterium]